MHMNDIAREQATVSAAPAALADSNPAHAAYAHSNSVHAASASATVACTSPTRSTSTYSTVFFDLDGTLLPMELDEFLGGYAQALGVFFGRKGLDAKSLVEDIFASTGDMGRSGTDVLNADAFWTAFEACGHARADFEPLLEEYYLHGFDALGANVAPNPRIVAAVKTLKDKGYRLAVTTMPLFPLPAVEARVRWAGLDPDDFEFMTTYDTAHAVKPQLAFYAEALERAGAQAREVLMVGNNTLEDGIATKLGCDLFLIEDFLIEREGGVRLDDVKHGSSADFLAFCERLGEAKRSYHSLDA